jgi:HSP20 family protein
MNTALVTRTPNGKQERVIVPPVDIFETENEYIVKADMPGVKKENIEITFNDRRLEISGQVGEESDKGSATGREFDLLNYYRSFNVGNDIDAGAISAKVENGVLSLKLPKREEVRPRKITVEAH